MKRPALLLLLGILFSAVAHSDEPPNNTLDIRLYRVTGEVHFESIASPAADPDANQDEVTIFIPKVVVAPPDSAAPPSLTVGATQLLMQGAELLWNGKPEPNQPDVIPIGRADAVEFQEQAGISVTQTDLASVAGAEHCFDGFAGVKFVCTRQPDGSINVRMLSMPAPLPRRTPHGTVIARGMTHMQNDQWQSLVVPGVPETWNCIVWTLSTRTGKHAGSILSFFRRHGPDTPPTQPEPNPEQRAIELKMIKLPASMIAEFDKRYELATDVSLEPNEAKAYRIGIERETQNGSDQDVDSSSPLKWLNDNKKVELISAPRITLLLRNDEVPPNPEAGAWKFLLRGSNPPAPGAANTGARNGDAPARIEDSIGDFSESLMNFLTDHMKQGPGIIIDAATEHDYDPENDEFLRYSYGCGAGVALKPVPDSEKVEATILFIIKTKETHGRGLAFWKRPPLPTFRENTAKLTAQFQDHECIAVARPTNDPRVWMMWTATLSKPAK